MVSIDRTASYFRPYSINGRQVTKIYFYDESGIVLTVPRGWIENQNNKDITKIVLDTDEIVTKRKAKFDKKLAYVMSAKEHGKPVYELYIHGSLVNLEEKEDTRKDFSDHTQIFKTFCMTGSFFANTQELYSITVLVHKENQMNSHGIKIDEMQKELKSKGIDLTKFDIERLLENYDLVAK